MKYTLSYNSRIYSQMRRASLEDAKDTELHLAEVDNAKRGNKVKTETVEEFLKRGGSVTKIRNTSYNYYRLNKYSVIY